MNYCKQCNASLADNASFCSECGTPVNKTNSRCSACGSILPEGATHCLNCDQKVSGGGIGETVIANASQAFNESQNQSQNQSYSNTQNSSSSYNSDSTSDYTEKSKVAAGLLGILVGSLGIHNFYLGYSTKAIIQLCLTVLSCGVLAFIPAIWGLVEGVMILTDDNYRDAKGNRLKS